MKVLKVIERCSYTVFLTSSLDEIDQRHAPAAYCPLDKRLGGPQEQYGWVRKISPPQRFDPRTTQPVAIRCTGYASSVHFTFLTENTLLKLLMFMC